MQQNDEQKTLLDLCKKFSNYNQIFKDIPKRGALYYSIKQLVTEYSISDTEICNYFNIKENSTLNDDIHLVYNKIGNFYMNPILLYFPESIPFSKELNTVIEQNPHIKNLVDNILIRKIDDNQKLEIIFISAIIISTTFLLLKLNRKSNNKENQLNLTSKERFNSQATIAICLGIPASSVAGLSLNQAIGVDSILKLIEDSSNFLCIPSTNADKLSVCLDPTQEPLSGSRAKFYIRINTSTNLSDAENLINAQTKFAIKRDLPPYIEGKIIELGKLLDITSISSFKEV